MCLRLKKKIERKESSSSKNTTNNINASKIIHIGIISGILTRFFISNKLYHFKDDSLY